MLTEQKRFACLALVLVACSSEARETPANGSAASPSQTELSERSLDTLSRIQKARDEETLSSLYAADVELDAAHRWRHAVVFDRDPMLKGLRKRLETGNKQTALLDIVRGARAAQVQLHLEHRSGNSTPIRFTTIAEYEFDDDGRVYRAVFWRDHVARRKLLGEALPGPPVVAQLFNEKRRAVVARFDESEQRNVELSGRLIEAASSGEREAFEALLGETLRVVDFTGVPPRTMSRRELGQEISARHAAIEVSRARVLESWGAADWTVTRFHEGYRAARDLPDLPGSAGKNVGNYHLWLIRFEAERVVELLRIHSRGHEFAQLGIKATKPQ